MHIGCRAVTRELATSAYFSAFWPQVTRVSTCVDDRLTPPTYWRSRQDPVGEAVNKIRIWVSSLNVWSMTFGSAFSCGRSNRHNRDVRVCLFLRAVKILTEGQAGVNTPQIFPTDGPDQWKLQYMRVSLSIVQIYNTVHVIPRAELYSEPLAAD